MGSGIASRRWQATTDSVSTAPVTRALVAVVALSIAERKARPSWTPGRWVRLGVRCDGVEAWARRTRTRARMTRVISWRTSWTIWRGCSSAAYRRHEDTRIKAMSSKREKITRGISRIIYELYNKDWWSYIRYKIELRSNKIIKLYKKKVQGLWNWKKL